MTTPRYVRTPDGRLVVAPAPIPQPEPIVEEEPRDDGISDLFEGPEVEDMSDLVEVSEETEISPEDVIGGGDADMSDDVLEAPPEQVDLFGVSEADVMEYPPKPRKPQMKRTIKRYPPPPTTLGGIRQ